MTENLFQEFDSIKLIKIEQTISFLEHIQHKPMVNRALAAEADAIFPVLKYTGESMFGETFSVGGLSSLTENLGGGTIALMAAAVAALGFGIYKLFKWMTKKEGDFADDTPIGKKSSTKSSVSSEPPKNPEEAKKMAQERLRYAEEKLKNTGKFTAKCERFIDKVTTPVTITDRSFNDPKIYNELPRKYRGNSVTVDRDFLDHLAWAIWKDKHSSMPWKMLYGDIYRVPALWLMLDGQSHIGKLLNNLKVISRRFKEIYMLVNQIFEDPVFEYREKIAQGDVDRIKSQVAKMDSDILVPGNDKRNFRSITKEMNEVADIISPKDREKSSIVKRLLGGSKYKEKKYKLSHIGEVLASPTYITTYEELTEVIATGDNSIYTCTATANEMFTKLQKSINDFAISEKHKKNVVDHGMAQTKLLNELKHLLTTVRLIIANQTDFFVMTNSFRLDLERMTRAYDEAGKITVGMALGLCRMSKEDFDKN